MEFRNVVRRILKLQNCERVRRVAGQLSWCPSSYRFWEQSKMDGARSYHDQERSQSVGFVQKNSVQI